MCHPHLCLTPTAQLRTECYLEYMAALLHGLKQDVTGADTAYLRTFTCAYQRDYAAMVGRVAEFDLWFDVNRSCALREAVEDE